PPATANRHYRRQWIRTRTESRVAIDESPPSPIDYSPAAHAFRVEIRDWLARNAPDHLRGVRTQRDPDPSREAALRSWAHVLTEPGYMRVGWPAEYGGRGLSRVEVAILNEEFAAADVPRLTRGMGESLVGPAITAHGSDAQKRQFLPPIISGDHVYCQG